MKYKALFLDLDGTTVIPFTNIPSQKVTDAVTAAREKLYVCLATGRLLYQSQPVIDHLKLSGLCVIANGMQIYDPIAKKIVKETPFAPKTAPHVYALLRKYTVPIHIFDGHQDTVVSNAVDLSKVMSFYLENIPADLAEQISKACEKFSDVVVHRLLAKKEGTVSIEICHALGTKQHAIFEVAKLLRIDTHEMIGVGDGYNDFSLLMACGLKIAMGNAVPELKAIADFIAPTVEEDGVATVIEKFILS